MRRAALSLVAGAAANECGCDGCVAGRGRGELRGLVREAAAFEVDWSGRARREQGGKVLGIDLSVDSGWRKRIAALTERRMKRANSQSANGK